MADGGPLWRDYLAFRDHPRADAAAARGFAAVKRALAGQFASDRDGYLHAKASHVRDILQRAGRAERSPA